MILLLIILLLIFVAAIFDSQKDRIAKQHSKKVWFPKWKWWISNNWENQPDWKKRILYMLLDGWHWCKWVVFSCYHVTAGLTICLALSISLYWAGPFYLVLHAASGYVFNKDYHGSTKEF